MLILCIGDPHFKLDNVDDTDLLEIKIENLIKEKSPDMVIVMGDILDRFETIHVSPLMRSISFLNKIKSKGVKLVILIGNHDRPNNNVFLTEEHPFTSLKEWENTTVVDKPIVFKNLLFVPYVPPGRFFEAIKDFSLPEVKVIFAHQEFFGAKMGAIVSKVEAYSESAPLCLSGHIHQYQKVQDNLIYIGTPLQHGFGDTRDKSVCFIETETLEIERVFLEIIPKIQVKLSPKELIDYVPIKGSNTKIVLQGDTKEINEVLKLKEIKELQTSSNLKIVSKGKKEQITLTEFTSKTSFSKRLSEFIETQDEKTKEVFQLICSN